MLWLVLAIVLLGVLTAIGVKLAGHEAEAPVSEGKGCATCDGDNAKCEQECMMEAAVSAIEYFDDEELDAFKGRSSDSYADGEAEQFREVLYTMRPDEVAAWCRSLTLRGVELPNQVKDEVMMLREEGTARPPETNSRG